MPDLNQQILDELREVNKNLLQIDKALNDLPAIVADAAETHEALDLLRRLAGSGGE
jgi:hypothetical protein